MTNASQGVTASLTLSAFGQTIASTGSSTSAYQYGATSGYRSEGDAGLTLVGCRFYDAQVGRFITRDTYLSQKPYAYCDGDPINAVDPTGHLDFWGDVDAFNQGVCGAIGGVLGAGLGGPIAIETGGVSITWGAIGGAGVGCVAGHELAKAEEAAYDYFKDMEPSPDPIPPPNGWPNNDGTSPPPG